MIFQSVNIIESKVLVHLPTGRQASPYGAAPWYSEAEKQEWELQTRGYTWKCVHQNGAVTIGACRVPAKTYEEAERVQALLLGN